jgi:hypothetical protein
LEPHALRQLLGKWPGQLVVQRTKKDAHTVDAFLRRERVAATATEAVVVRVRAGEGVWAVLEHGTVIARQQYSLKMTGGGLKALRDVLGASTPDAEVLRPPGGETGLGKDASRP